MAAEVRRDFSLFMLLVNRGEYKAEFDALMSKFFLLVAMLPTANILFMPAQAPSSFSAMASFMPTVDLYSGFLAPTASVALAVTSAGPLACPLMHLSIGSLSPVPVCSLSPPGRSSICGGPFSLRGP
jgi:hypothetical protein